MLQSFLDFLFPRRSLTGGDGAWITDDELRSLRCAPVILETHQLRSQKLMFIDRIVAAANYDSVPLLHRAVHLLKYKKVTGVVKSLGQILTDTSKMMETRETILCPIPLHWLRKFSRGFNQSELLAREVGKRRGLEVRNLLRRSRWTGSQVGRHRKDRLVGVQDAFTLRSGMNIPERVILIDDLSTTGATLDACAAALKKSGVKKVEGLVIALG